MENRHHQAVHSVSHRENESPPRQGSGDVRVAKYIQAEMISPESLLRSERFTKSKPTGEAFGQDEEAARVFEQQLRRREEKPGRLATGKRRGIPSPMSEAANGMPRRNRGTSTTPDPVFCKVKTRGRAPAKVRPMTAGVASKEHSLGAEKQGCEHKEGIFSWPSPATPSPLKMSDPSFLDMPAFNMFDSFDSELTEPCLRPQLSQSPLRPALATFANLPLGHLQRSSMQTASKISEKQPSSHLDEWSSRCFNLTQQIVEHLRSWNQLSSDSQMFISPTVSKPLSLKSASMDRLSQPREVCSLVSINL